MNEFRKYGNCINESENQMAIEMIEEFSMGTQIKVIGVETAGYSAMRQLLAHEPVTAGGDTIAEGIAVRDIGRLPLDLCTKLLDRIVSVDEVAIEHAIALLLEVEKTVAEGAGAAGLAAVLVSPGHLSPIASLVRAPATAAMPAAAASSSEMTARSC